MGDLLKEAIADAKAVRETALQNAKMALEEAFTPQLKSMLSAKLKEDEFGDEEEEFGGEEGDEEEIPADEMAMDELEGEEGEEEVPAEEPEVDLGDEEGGEETEEMYDEGIIEINGIKYAPIVSEDEVEGEEEFADEDEVEEGSISDLDLESVLKELDDEINESDDDLDESADDDLDESADEDTVDESADEDTVDESEEYEIDENVLDEDEESDEDKEEVDEISKSSGIGGGDNSLNAASGKDEEDPGAKDQFKTAKLESVQSELNEYKQAVGFLKDKLHEVNILNAKLLFTNKLFKEFALDNSDKLRIVETFDRAQTVREIKIVYATLAESFKHNTNIKSIKEAVGGASKSVKSTKPSKGNKKIISEETVVADRFRKLAGIIK
jgi:hypothetical protein